MFNPGGFSSFMLCWFYHLDSIFIVYIYKISSSTTTGVFKSLVNPQPYNYRYIVITKNYGIMKKLIQRIMMWLGTWPKDKVLHFTCCMVVSLIAGCIAKVCGAEWSGVMAAAWFAGFFIGVIKEVWDDIESQGSEEADWAADIIGTTLGTIIVTILTL